MTWDAQTQHRFDSLRQHAITTALSDDEQHELDALIAAITEEESQYLTPALSRLDDDLRQRDEQLAALQVRNEELAVLARQHEQLLREATSSLACYPSPAPGLDVDWAG